MAEKIVSSLSKWSHCNGTLRYIKITSLHNIVLSTANLSSRSKACLSLSQGSMENRWEWTLDNDKEHTTFYSHNHILSSILDKRRLTLFYLILPYLSLNYGRKQVHQLHHVPPWCPSAQSHFLNIQESGKTQHKETKQTELLPEQSKMAFDFKICTATAATTTTTTRMLTTVLQTANNLQMDTPVAYMQDDPVRHDGQHEVGGRMPEIKRFLPQGIWVPPGGYAKSWCLKPYTLFMSNLSLVCNRPLIFQDE